MSKIEVRLFATLRTGRDKQVYVDYRSPLTGRMVLDELNISEDDTAIFLINGRDGSLDQPLNPADYLSIFPPVGGG